MYDRHANCGNRLPNYLHVCTYTVYVHRGCTIVTGSTFGNQRDLRVSGFESRARQPKATLQARVDPDTAMRFAAIAMARGVSESALLREAIDNLIRAASTEIGELQDSLRREYESAARALQDAMEERGGRSQHRDSWQ